MSLKFKTLVSLLALLITDSANAAIDAMATGDGELFLSIRDNSATSPASYVLDLNTRISAWDGGTSHDWAADSTLHSFLGAGSGDYSWAVMAGDSTGGSAPGGLNFLTTAAAGSEATLGSETNFFLYEWSIMDTVYLANVNAVLGVVADSAIFAGTDAGFFDPAMDTWLGTSPVSATAKMGDTLAFYRVSNSGCYVCLITRMVPADVTTYAGTWSLASNGDLNYTAGTAATPILAAVWLLGSTLVGLAGVSRRRVVGVETCPGFA